LNKFYRNAVDGLCGNDDCGQMSAWYVFSVMGFYPVTPGSNEYVIGSPAVESTSINLENGKQFSIHAKNLSDKNIYIQSMTLNDKKYDKLFIRHEDIMDGGELIFEMGSTPNKQLGQQKSSLPYSMSNEE
jgi:putative alpha-1,2-mannosidase